MRLRDRLRPLERYYRKLGIAGEANASFRYRGRALVSYIPLPLMPPRQLRNRRMFSNRGIAQELVRVLNDLGYVVDMINWRDDRFVPKREYDVFIGHGGSNFARLSERLSSDTPCIYFATGPRWDLLNQACAHRAAAFADRHGWYVAPDRTVSDSEEDALNHADAIICIGSKRVAGPYMSLGIPVHEVPNAVFPGTKELPARDLARTQSSFLFFSGEDPILKGLDVFLDASARLPVTCHVCQRASPGFFEVYGRIGYGKAQVQRHGFVLVRSAKFYDLVAATSWIVAPTAAEGQPGGLLEAMATGLIPIISRDANLEVGDSGFVLDDPTPAHLGEVMASCLQLSHAELRRLSTSAKSLIGSKHRPVDFANDFEQALVDILGLSEASHSGDLL
jgi:glycosyltransferase involved in cell wall biosynthesis